jgi:phospholipid/cholesterol/gamma-HCH transport system permease protein
VAQTKELLIFLGQVTMGICSALRHPRKLRFSSVVTHVERFGVNALPIVCLMSMALGLVLAYQGEEQLRRFGAEIYTINLVSISVVREVGILITAILVAGRTGSAITAQLGIMKINQEVDALNTLGLDPMEILIVPRVLALIFVMPLLAFISDLAGLLGGGLMVVLSLDVSPKLYIYRIGESLTLWAFWIGIIKAPLFGAIIGVVSCFQGMRVKGTAESVGRCTTSSVVEGIFIVTLADALLSVFFSSVGV